MKLVVLLVVVSVLSACAAEYDHVAETKVEGVIVRVGLKRMHPVLAEYKRFLEVEREGKIEMKEIFPDTGGYAWVAVADDHGSLQVRDLGGVQYSGPVKKAKPERSYLGRFDFDGKKTYRFVPVSSDPREPQPPK